MDPNARHFNKVLSNKRKVQKILICNMYVVFCGHPKMNKILCLVTVTLNFRFKFPIFLYKGV